MTTVLPRFRVFVADPLPAEGLALLEKQSNFDLDRRSGLKGDELRAALELADAVIVRSGTTLTSELLAGLTRLRAIVRAGVGVDNIDVPTATRAGVVVMNTPGGNTISTAEQTIALLLAVCRHTANANASVKSGKWERSKFVGRQVAGKTLGIVGLGRVGVAVARRALGLEMRVVGYDPFFSESRAAELGIELVADLAELYPQSDVLTVHVPLGPETTGLVGSEQLAALPAGAIVINCARGGIVDESALVAALQSGHVAAAGLDVFVTEPPGEHPLLAFPNVVTTPHLGASTAEAQLNVAIEAAQLLVDFLSQGIVRCAVNMATVDPTELRDARRHLDIAYRLGRVQAQMAKGKVERAVIEYRGEATRKKTRLITAAFAVGLLESALSEPVNLVNALVLAEERGVAIEERLSNEPSDFITLLQTEVTSRGDALVVSGTTRGTQFNRLVRLGPFRLDAYLESTMLFYWHDDQPGLIGAVGTILGRHQVNIAQMTVGRKEKGGEAIGVLALDGEPPTAALEQIRQHDHIRAVALVQLPDHGEMPAVFQLPKD